MVTGSAKNIGRAINLALAEAGAAVVINALTSGAEAEALAAEIGDAGGRAMAHVADIRDPAAVEEMMAAAVERFGGLNFVVNNASLRMLTPLEEMTLEKWREIFAVTVEPIGESKAQMGDLSRYWADGDLWLERWIPTSPRPTSHPRLTSSRARV